ncbi:hypothetical protein [Tropicimonas sp. S265A]|uniref:hypothetical protein n=1 Tax=Tropicimonas sp. S265A TaxID=3415134 RepID=UPI003C7BA979
MSETTAKVSATLPIGAQAYFIEAAHAANRLGTPITLLLTVRWTGAQYFADKLLSRPVQERPKFVLEILRRHLRQRFGIQLAYLWCREICSDGLDHWHVALHAPAAGHAALAEKFGEIFGEKAVRAPVTKATTGEVTRGEYGTWHLSANFDPDGSGERLAAYLGKGERSWVHKNGKWVENTAKPFRGEEKPQGQLVRAKYDAPQGQVSGTTARYTRFGIAKQLKSEIGPFRGRWDRV